MNRRDFLLTAAAAAALRPRAAEEVDVLVYGSTPGGVAAAVEAARRGCSTVLACPKTRPGGMSASGLCTTDAVRRKMFGGFVLEFVRRVRADYAARLGEASPEWPQIRDGWFYAPSVAERVFAELLDDAKVDFRKGRHLVKARAEGARLVDVEFDDGTSIRAKTFIDGTYEGDLAAAAKVPYRVGREGRDEFGEPLAGIHYMNWRTGKQILTPDTGEPSPAIQAYCARSIFTDDEKRRVPIEKPATYDAHLPDFLPLVDDFNAGRIKAWRGGATLPGRRFEFNGAIEWATSFNCPGVSWSWPEADRQHRARLERFHVDHAAGMMWFLQNDPRVPDALRAQVKTWGLHAEEFPDTGHWPWQIYVRQGRRIEGRAKVTQHNFTIDPKRGRTPQVEQAVAVGEHSFDVHPCHDRRFAVDGYLEGVLWYPKKDAGPAQPGQIPWGAMLPKSLDNLLVPVALSSTHVAMSVLRMEPVWMTTGQLAGLAAAVAKEKRLDVAALDPEPLPKTLGLLTDPW
ncbi:MAG TPA: FAD-dependent oxidoreductase [Planctomycetota bacterium]